MAPITMTGRYIRISSRQHEIGDRKGGILGRYGKRRKKRSMKRLTVVLWGSIIIGAIVLSVFCARQLRSEIASSEVDVCFQGDTVSLIWKLPFHIDACRLYRYDEWTKEYLPYGEYIGQTIVMDDTAVGGRMRLRLRAVDHIQVFGHRISIPGFSRELTIMPVDAGDIALEMSADPDSRTVRLAWDAVMADSYEVYLFDGYGKKQTYARTKDNTILLDFDEALPMPDKDRPVSVAVRAVYDAGDHTVYGPVSDIAAIERDDLLEKDLFLEWEQIGERQYVLTWQACRGEWYEVQQWVPEEGCWRSEGVYHRTEDMRHQTGRLCSSRQVWFRVISYDDTNMRDREEFETAPSEVTFHTEMSPLYCTIWPLVPLDLLDGPGPQKVLGEVPAGQALCVLEEREGYFKVLYDDRIGYVDASFCMIDLPEYLGDLCEYDITSSDHCMSAVHGYGIPGITGTVIRGYENIRLGNGAYVVPYLYPCTQKLCTAITDAARDGYRFRIYDAFRPNEATRYYYDMAESMLDQPAGDGATLREIMTDNGKYRLSSFLAASVSAHNQGVALDLTLVDADTGEELEMQSDIHDLSAYSVIAQNNDNARLLAGYMEAAGFADLFSEWWHFQDDATRGAIGSGTYLRGGVSVEGWKRDDAGWRYQRKDGSFYKDTIQVIDGKEWFFDEDGYRAEGIYAS